MGKKLLLIQPTPYDSNKNLLKRKRLYFVGLALPLLAALTPEEWEVEIVLETIEEIPFDTDAQLVGISSMGHAVVRTIDIAKEFKRRGKTVVLGGYMVSLMPEEAKKYCDSVIIGDGEGVWEEVLKDWEAGRLQDYYQKELVSLRDLPVPRYDLIIKKRIGDFLPVQAGRGCPNSCSFCSVYCLYRGKYLRREISEVVRDIEYIKSLGYQKILLLDDNIAGDQEYMIDLCRALQSLNIRWLSQCSITIAKQERLLKAVKESGCLALSFGIESINQGSLNELNKGWSKASEYPELIRKIQKAGIEVSTEMMVGTDTDSLESIRATAKFIEDNKIVVPRFYILTPIPGTDLYHQWQEQGKIWNHNIYSYNGTEAVHIPAGMSAADLTAAYWNLYKNVFSIGSIIKRTLFNKNICRRPLLYLFYFFVNLVYRRDIKQGIPPNII
ncbi:MAG: B12-binding domain-containing radical SAM protein [Peptococcaceae bacterium]